MAFPEPLKLAVSGGPTSIAICRSLVVEVHHIGPQGQGGKDTDDNAAPLCPSCHETYGANPKGESSSEKRRTLV
jgi:hypothetical protein